MTKINFIREKERIHLATYGLHVSMHRYVLQRQQIDRVCVCVKRQHDWKTMFVIDANIKRAFLLIRRETVDRAYRIYLEKRRWIGSTMDSKKRYFDALASKTRRDSKASGNPLRDIDYAREPHSGQLRSVGASSAIPHARARARWVFSTGWLMETGPPRATAAHQRQLYPLHASTVSSPTHRSSVLVRLGGQ